MDNVASVIRRSPHLTAFGRVARAELNEIPINSLLMYVVDQVPAEALFYLASQFNVLGWRGWNLAQTEQDRRNLVKSAITMHRKKGTVFAIKEAVRQVGFQEATVVEGIGVDYDGAHNYDGSISYAGGNWATFRVIVAVDGTVAISPALSADIRAMVQEYKAERSTLIDISFRLTLSDTLEYSELLEYDDSQLIERLNGGVYYGGAANYDGSQLHNNGADSVNLRIFRNGILIEDGYY